LTHGLGTEDLVVQLWDLTGSDPVEATGDADSITVDDEDNITVAFSAPPATDSYRVVILSDGGTGGGSSTWQEAVSPDNGPGGTDTDEFDDASIDVAWTQVTVTGTASWAEGGDLIQVAHSGQSSGDAAA